MQRFLIYDDSPADAKVLADMLSARKECEVCTAHSETELLALTEQAPCAALFLDIELAEGQSGIRLAQALALRQPQLPIVFYTAHIRYCEDIFSVQPAALLLKPPTQERVARVLHFLTQKQESRGCITLAAGKNTVSRIPFSDIAYIESIQRRLSVFDGSGRLIASCYGRKLSDLAAELDSSFVCCHQSIYVNMQYITSIRRYALILKQGLELPISQSRFRSVRERWGEYLGESL